MPVLIPVPELKLLKPDICTMQFCNVLPSNQTMLPDAFKLYMMDTQPPPPTAWLPAFVTASNTRFTRLPLKLLPITDTDGASTAPMAPPHAEHATVVSMALGQVAWLF